MMRRPDIYADQLAHFHFLVAVVGLLLDYEERRAERERQRRRRWWVRPWIARRQLYGQYEQLMGELSMENPNDFKAFLRVDPQLFVELLNRRR